MARITNVTVTRFEGPSDLCDKPQQGTLEQAEATLAQWKADITHTAIDKCGFEIEIDGELAYAGRYELGADSDCSLLLHVANFLRFAKTEQGRQMITDPDRAQIAQVVAALAVA